MVGGGLLGVSAAYHLAQAGLRPLLLESDVPGAGATGRSAGMLAPGFAVPYPHAVAALGAGVARDLYHRSVENIAMVGELAGREGVDCDLAPTGLLTLGLGEQQCAAGRMLAAALAADGADVRVVERDELDEFLPTPVADEVGGGLLQQGAATVDPVRLVAGLAGAAQRHGAQPAGGVTVRSLAAGGRDVRLETTAGPVHTGAAVVALNAWAPALVPSLRGVVTPARAQMLAHAPTGLLFPVPVTAAVGRYGEYWRQTAAGRVLVGGRRDRDPDAATTAQAPTDEVQLAVEQVLPTLFPGLCLPPVQQRWAGTMALTPDGLPFAGPVPDVPGAWFAAGCNGHGLAFAVLLGRELARAVLDGRAPDGLAPFRPGPPRNRGLTHPVPDATKRARSAGPLVASDRVGGTD